MEEMLLEVITTENRDRNRNLLWSEARTRLNREFGKIVPETEFEEAANNLKSQGKIEIRAGVHERLVALPGKPDPSPDEPDDQTPPDLPAPQIYTINPETITEHQLMEPLKNWLQNEHDTAQHSGVGLASQYLLVDTSTGGAQAGKFSRPDFTVARLRKYKYSSVKYVELRSYELKKAGQGNLLAVHEALAHKRWVHYSTLVLFHPHGQKPAVPIPDLTKECSRYGIGLAIFKDHSPDSCATFQVLLEPEFEPVDPTMVDAFIDNRFSTETQQKIESWMGKE